MQIIRIQLKNLPAKVKNKDVEIANALLEKGSMEEGLVIATAISRAKDWAANRGLKTERAGKKSPTHVKQHGEDRYVIPYQDGQWAVKEEGSGKIEEIFPSRENAIKRASSEAKKANAAVTIQRRTGAIAKRVSYNPHKRAKEPTHTRPKQ